MANVIDSNMTEADSRELLDLTDALDHEERSAEI